MAPLLVLGLGVALGVLSELAGYLPHPWEYTSQLAAPWLVGAFFAGRLFRAPAAAAAGGVVVLVIGLVSVGALKTIAIGLYSIRPFYSDWRWWLAYSLVLGVPMGLASIWSRDRRQWIASSAWAIPAAVFAAEAVAIFTGQFPWGARVGTAELVAALAVGAYAASRSSSWRVTLAAFCAWLAVGVCLIPVVDWLNTVG